MTTRPDLIGKYRVIRQLGEGGMGAVYLAHDDGIDRDVAIKLLRANDERQRRRFQTEAQSAGRLKHPNVVTVYEYGEFQGEPYIAMEFVEGQTLANLIQSDGGLDANAQLDLLMQACRGLSYAHRSGVVHRDIKPSNLMVDHEGVLKIVDFGIARTTAQDLTATGQAVGTPAYMAPEQITGDHADARCDLFALGLVAFELLSGYSAFEGDSDYAIINKIVNGAPSQFRHPVKEIETLMVPVLQKALSKEPSGRYQTADEFAEALRCVREGVTAPPASTRPAADSAATVLIEPPKAPRIGSRSIAVAAVIVVAVAGVAAWRVATPAGSQSAPASAASEVHTPRDATAAEPRGQAAPTQVKPAAGSAPVPAPIQPQVATTPAQSVGIKTVEPRRREAESAKVVPVLAEAQTAMAAADYDRAIERFTQALTLDPSNVTATDGLSAARRAQDRVRAVALRTRMSDAEQKLSDGAYDDAIAVFDSILKADPANTDALDGVARARRAKAAEAELLKGRSKKPSGGQ